MMLQGLQNYNMPPAAMMPKDLSSLAGNAFSAHCCVALQLAVLASLPAELSWSDGQVL